MRSPRVGAGLGVAAAALLSIAGFAVALWPDEPPGLSRLVIATGGQGGVYYDYGHGLAGAARSAHPQADPVTVLETAASVANLAMVADGRADVAFTLADSAALAVRGEAPFVGPQPVAAVARLYDNYTQLVVLAQTPVSRLEDLRGRSVSTGAPESGTELIASRLLGVAGLDLDREVRRLRLGLAESIAALESGQNRRLLLLRGPADAGHRRPRRAGRHPPDRSR